MFLGGREVIKHNSKTMAVLVFLLTNLQICCRLIQVGLVWRYKGETLMRARMASLRHSWVISVFLLVSVCAQKVCMAGTYSDGDGSEGNPYQINSASDMQEIGANSNDWDKHFLLTADINLSAYTGTSFNLIGTDFSNSFTGVFDGNDHTISNFTWNSATADYVGLFGYIKGPNVEIKDLRLIDPNVQGK